MTSWFRSCIKNIFQMQNLVVPLSFRNSALSSYWGILKHTTCLPELTGPGEATIRYDKELVGSSQRTLFPPRTLNTRRKFLWGAWLKGKMESFNE